MSMRALQNRFIQLKDNSFNLLLTRFNEPGDVEEAFRLVLLSQGLEQTRQLAR